MTDRKPIICTDDLDFADCFISLLFDVREGEGLNCTPAHLLTPEVGVCPLYKYFEERVVQALRTETVW